MALVGDIIAFEQGQLSDREVLGLFSQLITNGMAWTLQGSYGRAAALFIEAGYIDSDGTVNEDMLDDLS